MANHLSISVTFLDPLFHGMGDDRTEWPPSPMRLFQALLAGSRTGWRERTWSDAKADAFRWLERRAPPQIVAPEAMPAAAYTLFVPNNDGDKVFDRQDRLTSKVARPHRLVCRDDETDQRQTLHYLWAIPEEEWFTARPHAESLCREARHLLALGWSIDQVVGNGRILTDAEVAALPGQRWSAWSTCPAGAQTWRVPTASSLEDLERVHQSFLRRVDGRQYSPPRKVNRFDSVTYLNATTLPVRPWAAFELPEGVAFRQEKANEVAATLRSLACNCARTDTHEFPGGSETFVAGHIADERGRTPPRFSYLPLPTIGHQHSDGMIRRLLIAEPYGGNGSHARWAQQRLCNQVLRDNDGNERGLLLDVWRVRSNAMVERYVTESTSWATVTPVILPGFDDGKQTKAERLLFFRPLNTRGSDLAWSQSWHCAKRRSGPGRSTRASINGRSTSTIFPPGMCGSASGSLFPARSRSAPAGIAVWGSLLDWVPVVKAMLIVDGVSSMKTEPAFASFVWASL